ncbi:MAG: hypothetical protein ACR2HC_09755 [Thermoleophilaceae bacterium]
MSADLAPAPDNMPDRRKVVLPSRAFLLSWRDQTLPARRAALDDAVNHFEELAAGTHLGFRDMAVLGVIGEALQPLEDLAYLGTGWDRPYRGIATYIRATTYTRFTATNFWQEAARWDDARLDVFAGFAGRDPDTAAIVPVTEILASLGLSFEPNEQAALDAARAATIDRLRRLLRALGKDWRQFSPYFLAYKHGGLAISRQDTAFVTDEVEALTDATPRHDPSIAVWTRGGRRQELQADFNLSQDELVRYAAVAGRLAIDLVDAFLDSRLAHVETLEYDDAGRLRGIKPIQLPWTTWLREQDLDLRHWKLLGRGPRITWIVDGIHGDR